MQSEPHAIAAVRRIVCQYLSLLADILSRSNHRVVSTAIGTGTIQRPATAVAATVT